MARQWWLAGVIAAAMVLPAAAMLSQSVAAKKAPAKQAAPAATPDAEASATQKPMDPAAAQKILDNAEKSLRSGRADHAIQQLGGLLSGARLQPRLMAQALYLRGAAYRKEGKPAQAIADLTSALWLKGGLSDADRTSALTERSEAYREAGLTDLAENDAKKIGRGTSASGAREGADMQRASAATSEQREAQATPRPAGGQQASGGISGFFSNLFGSSQSAPPAKRADAESGGGSEPAKAVRPQQPSVGEAWSEATEVKRAAASKTSAPAHGQQEPVIETASAATTTAKPRGSYHLQVAAVRSRKEAQALAARLKSEHGKMFGKRALDIDETVVGNMGTFYRVRVGPYADAGEPRELCPKLRGMGLDCLVIPQ